MSDTAVAVNFYHSLDVEGNGSAEVTFNFVRIFDLITELCYFFLGKILCSGIGIDTGLCKDIVSALAADTVNVGKGDFNALVVRNINTCYTCQSILPLLLD